MLSIRSWFPLVPGMVRALGTDPLSALLRAGERPPEGPCGMLASSGIQRPPAPGLTLATYLWESH